MSVWAASLSRLSADLRRGEGEGGAENVTFELSPGVRAGREGEGQLDDWKRAQRLSRHGLGVWP